MKNKARDSVVVLFLTTMNDNLCMWFFSYLFVSWYRKCQEIAEIVTCYNAIYISWRTGQDFLKQDFLSWCVFCQFCFLSISLMVNALSLGKETHQSTCLLANTKCEKAAQTKWWMSWCIISFLVVPEPGHHDGTWSHFVNALSVFW